MALAAPGLRAEHVGEKSLGGGIAVQDRILAALLEIHHELQRHARAARPARIGGVAAVTGEIAWIIGREREAIAALVAVLSMIRKVDPDFPRRSRSTQIQRPG